MQVTNKNFPGRKIKISAQLLEETITCVDSHTGGEPTRLVIGGMPLVKGNTIREKKQYLTEHYDHMRTTLPGAPCWAMGASNVGAPKANSITWKRCLPPTPSPE